MVHCFQIRCDDPFVSKDASNQEHLRQLDAENAVLVEKEIPETPNIRDQTILDAKLKRKKCKRLKQNHKVQPGVSWGTMNTAQQTVWMDMQCDAFFCQPNKLAGKGVYKCIPLKDE